MRIYVAGPMTGYENFNATAFQEAAARLRAQGHDVITPHELNAALVLRETGRPFDPTLDAYKYGDAILDRMYAEDMREVCLCDAVALLPGFEASRGSGGELHVAKILDKTLLDATTGEPMDVTTEWRVLDHSAVLGS